MIKDELPCAASRKGFATTNAKMVAIVVISSIAKQCILSVRTCKTPLYPSATTCENSPHLTTIREHVFVCGKKEKKKKKKRRTARRKKMSASETLYGLTCRDGTRVTHSYGTEMCTRAQLAND